MKRPRNELMFKHTTFRVGGPAKFFSIPSNEKELIQEVKYCIKKKRIYHILGNGSNVLVKDEGIKGNVILNKYACTKLKVLNGNTVEVGSSVSLQMYVKFCVDHNLGGIEYLFSIPGTVGGAIYTNAGRGKSSGLSISDHLESVRVFNGKDIVTLGKKDCNFSFRRSIFQKRNGLIILSAKFIFPKQPKKIGEEKIKERLAFTKKIQDLNFPNAGSIFKESNHHILKLLRGKRVGGAYFSRKTSNWILNNKNATAKDILRLINYTKVLHKLIFKKAILEIEIW